jgi:hypothetical protein
MPYISGVDIVIGRKQLAFQLWSIYKEDLNAGCTRRGQELDRYFQLRLVGKKHAASGAKFCPQLLGSMLGLTYRLGIILSASALVAMLQRGESAFAGHVLMTSRDKASPCLGSSFKTIIEKYPRIND